VFKIDDYIGKNKSPSEKIKTLEWLNFFSIALETSQLGIFSCLIERLTMFIIFVYFFKCKFWLISRNYDIVLSKDTDKMIKKYIKN